MKTTTIKLALSIVALLMLLNVAKSQQLRVLCTSVVMSEPVPASIITQPADTSVCAGNNAMFFISATGDEPIIYQWQKDGVDISGAVNDTLFLTNIVASDTGQYRCIVNNGCGGDTSGIANLTLCSCIVNIPDANFKNYLISNATINANSDTEIQCSEAVAFSGTLLVANKNIADLTGIEAFTALDNLNCYNNQLTSIDVSANVVLTTLNCGGNQLTDLDVSANIVLSKLYCYNNQLNNLNVSGADSLTELWCYNNQITSLDVSANAALSYLNCYINQLTDLNVSANTSLTYLNFNNNQLTNLNVTNNTLLNTLYCHFNQLTSLDVSSNTLLTQFYCYNNQLTSLNVKNGNNSNFIYFLANNNPNLSCIQVDDTTWANSNWTVANGNIDATSHFSIDCAAECIVNIPDANFKAALVANTLINTNSDSYIQCSEASAFSGSIDVNSMSISDLTGIEAFTSLTELYCYGNNLTSLNVSQNTALTKLYCYINSLSSIDVSNNTALTHLVCNENPLNTIDISANIQLQVLGCYSTNISNLDLSNNTNLTELGCGMNQLTSLDLSNNTLLTYIDCGDNQITSLNLSSHNSLADLFCQSNNLTSLNIQNGNNVNFNFFDATVNPNLICIQVDDTVWANANWTAYIDSTSHFSIDCAAECIVNIPDANFKAALLANSAINTNSDGEIQCSEANAFTGSIDVSNLSIVNLSGIEAFTAITNLNCNNNLLTSLNISENTALDILNCYNNQLLSLDISANTSLTFLGCGANQLTSLNVSANTALNSLFCYTNQLTSLDVTANTALTELDCSTNQLTSLDVTANTSLSFLECGGNQITSMNLFSNTTLTNFGCSGNQLTSLNLSANVALAELYCGVNQLTSLNLSANTVLFALYCNNNQLTSLNIKNGNNINLAIFDATNNPSLTCIQVDDSAFMNTNWAGAKDSWASYNENCNTSTLSITSSITNANCFGSSTASIDITISGGTTPYTYIWSNSDTTEDLTNIPAGIYYVTVTDAASATLVDTFVVDEVVYIPDANFKAALLANSAINTNLDGEIQCSEATVYSSTIDVSNLGVSDLTGIEAFTSLNVLYCWNNLLTSLNVSNNTALTILNCYSNQLSSIDLSSNTALFGFNCYNNQLTSLNISSNTALSELGCNGNLLTSLDVSSNTALTSLDCSSNQLTILDVSANTALSILICFSNQLTSLNLNSNTALTLLECTSNQLTSLNVKNGNNTIVTDFFANNNPLLSCIQVDNAAWSSANWTSIDAGASFSEDCSSAWCIVNIPDTNFKAALVANALINTNADGEIQCSEAAAYSDTLNVNSMNIADLTGIEAFTSIIALNCVANQLTSLNVSANIALIDLDCDNNLLTSLNVSTNTVLSLLNCAGNQLTSLDVSTDSSLSYLNCGDNQLTSLDVSTNSALTELDCGGNLLTSLNVKNGNNINFTFFWAVGNPNLSCIQVDDSAWSTTNWLDIDTTAHFSINCATECVVNIPDVNFKAALVSNSSINTNADSEIQCSEASSYLGALVVSGLNIADLTGIEAFTTIVNLDCSNNLLTSLNISANTPLIILNCSGNQLTGLNISSNTALTALYCYNNQISGLDVLSNTALITLYCNNNQLTSLDISANTVLKYLNCSINQLINLDVSLNTSLITLDCSSNLFTGLNVSANTALTTLYCSNNQLTGLDVSANTSLATLYCLNNQLSSLNISANPALSFLNCYNNQLTSLNVKNGNNINFTNFNAINNPSLTCIQVDSAAWSTANWTNIDVGASFSENCSASNLLITSSITNANCFGSSTGSIDITVSGGATPYTFAWSNLSGLQDLTGLVAGTYIVTVTDASSATLVDTFVVSEPLTLDASTNVTNTNCGQSDGSASVNVVGGTSPYTYIWTDSETTNIISSKPAGNYCVTITDANYCTLIKCVTISDIAGITSLSTTQTNVSCNGGSDGTASVTTTGGTPPYTYLWTLGQTTMTATGLSGASSYCVTVTDNVGCNLYSCVTIQQPTIVTAAITASDTTSCFGGNDGWATVTGSGGISPYSYQWSGGTGNQVTSTATNLAYGVYCVTVKDVNNCVAAPNCVTIYQPPVLNANITSTLSAHCGNADGSATVTATGGTQPYSYAWPSGTSANTATVSDLLAGNYIVTVSDAKSCQSTASATISDIASGIAAISVQYNASCDGSCDGSLTVSVSGATPPYNYNWSDGQSTVTAINLCFGVYCVTVTDAYNCSMTVCESITEPVQMILIADSIANAHCNQKDGAIYISVSNGPAPFSYIWSYEGIITEDIDSIFAGSYCVTVTNAQGCTIDSCYIVGNEPAPVSTISAFTNLNCYQSCDGTATVSATGGTGIYTYNWSDGQSVATATNLCAGIYTVTVTDEAGCSSTTSVTITEPPYLNYNIISSNPLCADNCDGWASVTPFGGTAPYTYSWTGGGTNQNDSLNTGLCAQNYNILITDANGCDTLGTVSLSQPSNILLTTSFTEPSCFGSCDGTASVVATGGTSPFTYIWNDFAAQSTDIAIALCSNNYTVTVTDDNGCTSAASISVTQPVQLQSVTSHSDESIINACDGAITVSVSGGTSPYTYNWSNASTSQNISNLCAGVYNLTVTDANGCTSIFQDSILAGSLQSPVAEFTADNVVFCSPGIVSFNDLSTGNPTSWYWDFGDGIISMVVNPAHTYTSSGVYTVTLIVSNGIGSDTITKVNYILVGSPEISLTSTNLSCFGNANGSAIVNVINGISPFSYSWSNGSTNDSIGSLSANIYNVVVYDSINCFSIQSVTITQPPQITISANITNATTYGSSDGAIDVTVSGGTSPYSYSWANGNSTEDLSNISAGIYYLTVTDDFSCQFDSSFEVTEPASVISLTSSVSNVSCNGFSDGSIEIIPSGGQTPYSYLWSNGETINTLSAISSSTFSVTVTDANSAYITETFTITEPPQLIASILSQTDVTCFGLSDGLIISNVIGGTLPYSYLWSDSQTTPYAINLFSGSYDLTVYDANFCESTINSFISEPAQILISSSVTDVTCGATSDGAINLTVSGGVSPYTFNWSNGSSIEDLLNIPIGIYTITITDGSSCALSQNFNVGSGGNIIVTDSVINVSCFGANDGQINLNVSGGTPPFSINWSNGSTLNNLSNLSSGNYSVTISDSTSCSKVISYNITQPVSELSASGVSTTVADCNYSCSGSASLTIIGGTSPYNYLWSGGQSVNPALNMCPGMNTVTITDANGCFKQYSVQINIESLSKIKGNIYYSGILLPVDAAIIELWKETTSNNSGKQKVGDLHNVNNGYYEFTGLSSGTYYVKAKIIAQGDYPNTLPTWYDTTSHWFYASPIVLECSATQNININMLQVPAMANGNTEIHGKVTTATTNKSILGEPIPGAEITLEQEPDDEPIISTSTGNDGTYDFMDIPSASYIIVVDIPGYTQFETYNITVNPNDISINNLNFVVDTNDVGLGIYVDHTIFVPLVNGKFMAVNVFPNPFTENINIEFTLEELANVKVDIIDALGKNVINVCNDNQSVGKHSYNFKDELPVGVYFVKISIDNTVYVKKIVRKG